MSDQRPQGGRIRPQPTRDMMVAALAHGPRTVVEVTMITRCHWSSVGNVLRQMWQEGRVGRTRRSRRDGDVYHLVSGLSLSDR